MATSRRHPEAGERQEPVITYSRVNPRPPSRQQRGARQMEIERIEPLLTETAVPLAAAPERLDSVEIPERRRDVLDLDETIVDEPVADESDIATVAKDRRPRSVMFLVAGALVAVVAGIGVLYATFATVTTSDAPAARDDVSAAVSSAAATEDATATTNEEMIADIEARLAALEGKTDLPTEVRKPGDVREVSLSTGESMSAEGADLAAPVEATPPAPRLRPERVATAAPEIGEAPAAPKATAKPVPQVAAPSPAGDDDFIATIERALADNGPAPGSAGTALGSTGVDPTLEPGFLPPAATEDGPALDMLPADGPVPPEPIPNVGSIQ